jgi:hypothetical protein
MGKQIAIGNSEIVKRIFATRLKGTISPLRPQTGKLEKFTSANITVIATSKELVPHAPNEFGAPKWVRTAKAKSIGAQCTYSIVVPPGKNFYATASGHGRGFACTSIEVWLTPTGAAIGPIAIPLGATKTLDLRVSKVKCIVLT